MVTQALSAYIYTITAQAALFVYRAFYFGDPADVAALALFSLVIKTKWEELVRFCMRVMMKGSV